MDKGAPQAGGATIPIPRVYVDTMILVYFLGTKTKPGLFTRSERFLNKVIDGKLTGIVTTFTIAECLAVLATAYAERDGVAPTPTQMQQARTRVENFVRAAGMEGHDADLLSQQASGLVSAFARVMDISMLTQPVKAANGDWKGPGGADALHVFFAERSTCDQLATFDQGFKNVQSSVSILML